ncbi:Zinc finger, ZZ type [Musa troglodytarum]|uniref:Zinc finger, ZZ type n=1 Tax=Musa troglodytarum TaxID=320322 RepID=A0A9E7EWX9_9LILI|nr:Zinc finger, ZZ type [Musa troglodytarum]
MDLVSKEGKRKVSWRSKVADSAAGSLGRRPASGLLESPSWVVVMTNLTSSSDGR